MKLEERPIKWQYESREEWLRYIPDLVNKLSNQYGFYWSTKACPIKKDIEEVLKRQRKNRHKIMLYYREADSKMYLVVLSRKEITIYFCDYADTISKVNYFSRKAAKRYERKDSTEYFKQIR